MPLLISKYVECYTGFVYNSADSVADIEAALAQIYTTKTLTVQKQSNNSLLVLDSGNHAVFSEPIADGNVISCNVGEQELWNFDPAEVAVIPDVDDFTANVQLTVSGTAGIQRTN